MIAILLMTLAQFIAHTRAELAKGGLERVEVGESVYWRGGKGDVRLHVTAGEVHVSLK